MPAPRLVSRLANHQFLRITLKLIAAYATLLANAPDVQIAIMPKAKTTATRKTKGKASEKKKKGNPPRAREPVVSAPPLTFLVAQTPMPPSAVSRRTCSSPTTSVRRSARRTPVSHSVSPRR